MTTVSSRGCRWKLRNNCSKFIDSGTNDGNSVDYPDIALAVGRAIRGGEAERGFLVCGSGVGAVVAANKLRGVRAAICHDTYSAHQGVEHDDMNVVCMGSRVIGEDVALEIVEAFVAAKFRDEERYRRRLAKVKQLVGDRGDGGHP